VERIETLLGQMTLEEKVSLLSGANLWETVAVPRLSIPSFKMTDGPNGARGDAIMGGQTAACFPVGSALASSWNKDLIGKVGVALGQEAKTKTAQVLLGPTINLQRTPIGGRNFECYSEDPYLTAEMAVAYSDGVQSENVGVCPKHFLANDTEFERHTISSNVGERALRELYLVPFEAVVSRSKPWSIMSSYNMINGTYASSHRELLVDVLKNEYGFDGFVVSDWGACKETVGNANGGLDLEMPGPARTFGSKLVDAVNSGDVDVSEIDDKVRRLLAVIIKSGRMDNPQDTAETSQDLPEHRALAFQAAVEGMVLIKNDKDVLPFIPQTLKTVAVIGPNAKQGQIQGGGSSGVKPHYQVHPLAGIIKRLGPDVEVLYEVGCSTHKYCPAITAGQLRTADGKDGYLMQSFSEQDWSGEITMDRVMRTNRVSFWGAFAAVKRGAAFSARVSAKLTPNQSGLHTFGMFSAGQTRLFLDDVEVIDNWRSQEVGDSFYGMGSSEKRGQIELKEGREYDLRIDFLTSGDSMMSGVQFGMEPPVDENVIQKAVDAAAKSDCVIIVAGTNPDWETEGNDRADMTLPGEQDALIKRVLAVNRNTAIVMNSGSAVDMPWLDDAPALIQSWFGGQEFGAAIAALLFGDENPSGRMPLTVPHRLEDTPAYTSYPGENGQMPYGEGIYLGYRWYDTRQIEPRVCFGHGLSYSAFDYSNLVMPKTSDAKNLVIQIDVTNTGNRVGQEVVQLYVHDVHSSLPRPAQELKGFEKVTLDARETKTVTFTLNPRSFSFWHTGLKQGAGWHLEAGEFEVRIGASSRDIRHKHIVTITA
jgi:beta-glucosidase